MGDRDDNDSLGVFLLLVTRCSGFYTLSSGRQSLPVGRLFLSLKVAVSSGLLSTRLCDSYDLYLCLLDQMNLKFEIRPSLLVYSLF
mmetsp:Transcript_26522/g.58102  ORF Transcript_26522/g.58102 Transcript_26522/m.58102 type:complete len:86 (-) Transcript_26522:427-684(-)